MRKITLLVFLVAFAFSANAQLRLGTDPFNGGNNGLSSGVNLDTLKQRTIQVGTEPSASADTLDISMHWHFTPSKVGTWDPVDDPTGSAPRNLGAPTVVPSAGLFTFTGTPGTAVTPENTATTGETYLMPPQTVSTRRGFVFRATSKSDYNTTRGNNGYFDMGANFTAGGDPIWFNSLADMKEYVTSGKFVLDDNTYRKDEARTDYGRKNEQLHWHNTSFFQEGMNYVDSVLAVVINKRPGDGALGIYPGKFKEIDIRFSFRSDRRQPTQDITFDLFTLDPGNTGKTATWDVIVTLVAGNAIMEGDVVVDYANSPDVNGGFADARDLTDFIDAGTTGEVWAGTNNLSRRWVQEAAFTTSLSAMSDSVNINVNKILGLKPIDLFNKTVIIALKTKGTEGATDNATGTVDPMIVIDNIKWGSWNKQIPTDGNPYRLPEREEGGTSISKINVSSTKVISQKGQIEIIGAQAGGTVFSITGQKVATFAPGSQAFALPAGIYLVKEQNQATVKVLVK